MFLVYIIYFCMWITLLIIFLFYFSSIIVLTSEYSVESANDLTSSYETKILTKRNLCRSCSCLSKHSKNAFGFGLSFLNGSFMQKKIWIIFLVILFTILFLLLLGLIKGIIGCCISRRIGECGLEMLIDLPRPLDRYQEKELKRYGVVYDVGGWPIHPVTGEKTVKILPRNIEFCLNLIFFLVYPVAVILRFILLCFCITASPRFDDDVKYKQVNIIKVANTGKKKEHKSAGPTVDMYTSDAKEAEDTNYVLHALKESEESLLQLQ